MNQLTKIWLQWEASHLLRRISSLETKRKFLDPFFVGETASVMLLAENKRLVAEAKKRYEDIQTKLNEDSSNR